MMFSHLERRGFLVGVPHYLTLRSELREEGILVWCRLDIY
jgi:hypothetical protein